MAITARTANKKIFMCVGDKEQNSKDKAVSLFAGILNFGIILTNNERLQQGRDQAH
jgi:hypothetical protein